MSDPSIRLHRKSIKNLVGVRASLVNCLKQMFEKDLYFMYGNFELGIKMEPHEVAEIVIDRVVDYCRNNSGDSILECLADHSPDDLSTFIDAYLAEEEDNELEKEVEKSDKFWDEVEKEYEALWKSWITTKVANLLGDEIDLTLYSIIDNSDLDNDCKARRLKAYAEVLDKFGDAVLRALQERKPLSESDLDYWFTKLGDTAFGVKNYNYYEEIGYYLGYYDSLDDNDKLDLLNILLDKIDNAFYDINDELRELGALTNKS